MDPVVLLLLVIAAGIAVVSLRARGRAARADAAARWTRTTRPRRPSAG